jgi:L-ascorbate metabolism protein UlaG (beta-lactamase superfamily)
VARVEGAREIQPDEAALTIGARFTMSPAVKRFFKLDTAIPCHYGSFPIIEANPDKFVAQMKAHHQGAGAGEAQGGEPGMPHLRKEERAAPRDEIRGCACRIQRSKELNRWLNHTRSP